MAAAQLSLQRPQCSFLFPSSISFELDTQLTPMAMPTMFWNGCTPVHSCMTAARREPVLYSQWGYQPALRTTQPSYHPKAARVLQALQPPPQCTSSPRLASLTTPNLAHLASLPTSHPCLQPSEPPPERSERRPTARFPRRTACIPPLSGVLRRLIRVIGRRGEVDELCDPRMVTKVEAVAVRCHTPTCTPFVRHASRNTHTYTHTLTPCGRVLKT